MVTILDSYGVFRCSGTILTKKAILTAAHCFNWRKFKVIINGKSYSIKKSLIYPEYQKNIHLDVAIGILDKDIEAADFHPVTLDANDSIPKSLSVIGRSKHITSPYPDYVSAILLQIPRSLLKVNSEAYAFIQNLSWSKTEEINNHEHVSFITKTYRSETLNETPSGNIYYNNLAGGPLPGDSGGAVIVENRDGTFFQRGITQFVKVNFQFPDYLPYRHEYHVHDSTGYANISFYLPWLRKMAHDFKLGDIKTRKSRPAPLSACEEVKFTLNQQFIEKLSFNLLDSIIKNNCQGLDQGLVVKLQASLARCQERCGKTDDTCQFSRASIVRYHQFQKLWCQKR